MVHRACYGSPNGDEVTPEQFMELATPKFAEKGIFPFCIACKEILDPYGVHSPKVTSRFDHRNLSEDSDPLDDCILARRNGRFRGLEPDGWDRPRGELLRSRFFEEFNLKIAYSFCLRMCGNGNLPVSAFRRLIHRADQKNIWSYSGIPLWSIPYILLSLDNFVGRQRNQIEFPFHFVFDKPKNTTVSVLWLRPNTCKLKKVYSTTGKLVDEPDNPFPVSLDAYRGKAGDGEWIHAHVTQLLKQA